MQDNGRVPELELDMHSGLCGKLRVTFPGEATLEHTVALQEVPTIIELFKSHNHTNWMKVGDVGQVLVVFPIAPQYDLQLLIDAEQAGTFEHEVDFGITPPMAAGRRVFKYQPKAEPQLVASVEKQLVDLMHGEAPQDWIIEDVAEIWVPDAENASGGAWLPLADVSAAKLKELAAAT